MPLAPPHGQRGMIGWVKRGMTFSASILACWMAAFGVVGCAGAGGSGGCAPGIDDGAFPSSARLGHVRSAGTTCREDDSPGWRSWVVVPPAGVPAEHAQVKIVDALHEVGWQDLSGVPPVAAGFRSLCRPGRFATIFTAKQAARAEMAGEFLSGSALRDEELEVSIGKSNAPCPGS